MRYSDLLSGLFRVGLAAAFGYAAFQKLTAGENADAFLSSLLQIDISGAGFLLGMAEATLAVMLFLNIAPRVAARAAVVASAGFVTLHAYTTTLPEPPPPCGCLGAASQAADGQPLPWLWITGSMLFASAFLLWRAPRKNTPSPADDQHTEAIPA